METGLYRVKSPLRLKHCEDAEQCTINLKRDTNAERPLSLILLHARVYLYAKKMGDVELGIAAFKYVENIMPLLTFTTFTDLVPLVFDNASDTLNRNNPMKIRVASFGAGVEAEWM